MLACVSRHQNAAEHQFPDPELSFLTVAVAIFPLPEVFICHMAR